MNTKLSSALMLVVFLILSGCSFQSADPLAGTKWTVVKIGEQSVLEGSVLPMEFKDGSISGTAGCNGYGGKYKVSGSTIQVDSLFSTMMACMGEGVMEQEQAFLSALGRAARFAQPSATELTLSDADGNVLLTLLKESN